MHTLVVKAAAGETLEGSFGLCEVERANWVEEEISREADPGVVAPGSVVAEELKRAGTFEVVDWGAGGGFAEDETALIELLAVPRLAETLADRTVPEFEDKDPAIEFEDGTSDLVLIGTEGIGDEIDPGPAEAVKTDADKLEVAGFSDPDAKEGSPELLMV